MTKLTALALGAGIALASISLAHADPVTGAWKLSVGVNDDPCTITLTADGATDGGNTTSAGDCNGVNVAHYQANATGLKLLAGNGELVAWLKPKDGAYEGKRISDGRQVALNR
jgi:hypothetical protein